MMKKECICPYCLKVKLQKEMESCPQCHSKIPPEVWTSELFPIAVIGASSAGKTHFLAVLAHVLNQNPPWKDYWKTRWLPRVAAAGQSDADENRLSDDEFRNWEEKLYPERGGKGTILDQTDKRNPDEPPQSLVIHIEYDASIRNWWKEPRLGRKKGLLLAFTDTAGEDFARLDEHLFLAKYPIFSHPDHRELGWFGNLLSWLNPWSKQRKCLAESTIALLNPSQLSSVKEQLTNGRSEVKERYAQWGLKGGVHVIMQSVLAHDVIKKMRRRPLALCLMKTDALIAVGEMDRDGEVASARDILFDKEDKKLHGKINLQALDELSESTLEFILSKDTGTAASEGSLADTMENFKYSRCFAIDALGSAIGHATVARVQDRDGGEKVVRQFSPRPEPRRIFDPLLWVLWQNGKVGGKCPSAQ